MRHRQKGDLTRAERLEIGILADKGYSHRKVAEKLGRSHNTISYEIKKNSVRKKYDPLKADAKARLRKRMRRLQFSKIEEYPEIKDFIVEKLKVHWNPDEIAGFLKRTKDARHVSKTAIYEWLRTSRGERYCEHLYSKRKRVKKRKPKTKKTLIPNRTGIERRNASVDNRTRYGHWERDSVVSKKGCAGGLATHQERKSRFVAAVKVKSMRPDEHARATQRVFQDTKMLSMTTDNGIENRDHEQWGMPTFFCDPYSSWQKGGIENANKMLRHFFPKGTDFATVTQKEIDRACGIINDKPRKILGYWSSRGIAEKAKLLKTASVLIEG
jgi:IS30 family transposase